MRHHLNTLYVTTQGSYLRAERETLSVCVEDDEKIKIPLHLLEGIVCFGRVGISPYLMHRCAERGIGISLLSERGRFLARIVGPTSGNVLLRREQYRRTDDSLASAEIARGIVAAKIISSRSVLERALRDHPEAGGGDIKKASSSLKSCLRRLKESLPLDVVRGIEGEAAKAYFGVFDILILTADGFIFEKRTRRPPTDPVNAVLSFVYTLLTHDVRSALEAVGLDPQVGYLHRERPGRPSLALDLVEEFRPYIADRLALTLVNRRQIRPAGFEVLETGAVSADEQTRKTILNEYQERKNREIIHPFLNEKTTVGMLPHIQSLLMARFLRGDLEAYPPFFGS